MLNERLAGLTVAEIRTSLADRLRDVGESPESQELLNIFIAEGEEIFDLSQADEDVALGSAGAARRAARVRLEHPDARPAAADRAPRPAARARCRPAGSGLTITIGGENVDPRLTEFTLVTASYRAGDLRGVIGVLGPTRMPYDKIIVLVEHTSRLVEGLLT